MRQLTPQQLKHQDLVDNAIHNMLKQVLGRPEMEWNMEDIGNVRDLLVNMYCTGDKPVMSEVNFYPYVEFSR